MKVTVVLQPEAEGGYSAVVPALPGVVTQGETLDETRENLKKAVALLLECYREDAENRFENAVDATKEELVLQAA